MTIAAQLRMLRLGEPKDLRRCRGSKNQLLSGRLRTSFVFLCEGRHTLASRKHDRAQDGVDAEVVGVPVPKDVGVRNSDVL
ncbi:MAG: hypothetical protein QOC77_3344, partial [Thermoleophilaceae bacterium]|nr:hypothetical protein [Thermoleophilaceae bacterium]